MRLDKKCKIELVASSDSTRSHLCHPFLDVDAKVLVATDGHRLIKHPVEVDPADVSGYISADALKVARKLNRADAQLVIRATSDALELLDGTIMPRPTSKNSFPPYDRVIPNYDNRDTITVALDAKYLMELCQALGGNAKDGTAVSLTFPLPTDGDAMLDPFVVDRSAGSEAVAILMPVNHKLLSKGK